MVTIATGQQGINFGETSTSGIFGIRAKDEAGAGTTTHFVYIGGFKFLAESDSTLLFNTTGDETEECMIGGMPIRIYRSGDGWVLAETPAGTAENTVQLTFLGYPVTARQFSGIWYIDISEKT